MIFFWIGELFFALLAGLNYRLSLYFLLAFIPSFLIRDKIGFIPTTFLEIGIYILAISWIFRNLHGLRENLFKLKKIARAAVNRRSPKGRERNFLSFFILFFFVSAVVAAVLSPDKRLSFGVLKGWYFDPFLLALLVYDDIRKHKNWDFIFSSLNLSVLWLSIYGLLEKFFGVGEMKVGLRLDSIYESPNYFTMYVGPILAMNFALILSSSNIIKNRRTRLLVLVSTIIGVAAFYFSQSFGGFFALGSALAFLLLKGRFSKIAWWALGFMLAVIFFLFLNYPGLPQEFLHKSSLTGKSSLDVRMDVWKASVLMIRDNPIFGIGLGHFAQAYNKYIYKVRRSPLELKVIKPHNVYLNFWAEQGILGLISFMALMIYFFFRKPAIWFQVGIVAILVHGLVDTTYFKNDLSVIFWVIFAISIERGKFGQAKEKGSETFQS